EHRRAPLARARRRLAAQTRDAVKDAARDDEAHGAEEERWIALERDADAEVRRPPDDRHDEKRRHEQGATGDVHGSKGCVVRGMQNRCSSHRLRPAQFDLTEGVLLESRRTVPVASPPASVQQGAMMAASTTSHRLYEQLAL